MQLTKWPWRMLSNYSWICSSSHIFKYTEILALCFFSRFWIIFTISLCLLVGASNPFTFKVIIDKYDPVAIYFVVLGLCLYTLSVFPVSRRFFSIWWRELHVS